MMIFWLVCLILLFFASAFILPWLPQKRARLCFVLFLIMFTFGCYYYFGSSQQLTSYYVTLVEFPKQKISNVQKLFTEFKKYEFKLRQRLEDNPKDIDAEWRLLDVLAIKALQNGELELAKAYWENALKKLPEGEATLLARERILKALSPLK
jgi:cytochrome c-type biogenesis protein CcmH/NrfG